MILKLLPAVEQHGRLKLSVFSQSAPQPFDRLLVDVSSRFSNLLRGCEPAATVHAHQSADLNASQFKPSGSFTTNEVLLK
jgi:hypothetical protein